MTRSRREEGESEPLGYYPTMDTHGAGAGQGTVLPWGPSAPAAARDLSDRALADVPGQARREARLVVSELVTNAVLHGERPLRVRVSAAKDRVTIEVADGGAAEPSPRLPAPEEAGGRGLDIVAQLASEWGWRRLATGKTVWCWIPLTTPGG